MTNNYTGDGCGRLRWTEALQAFELLRVVYEPFRVQLQACIFILLPASFQQNWPNKFKLVCDTENAVLEFLLIFMFFSQFNTP